MFLKYLNPANWYKKELNRSENPTLRIEVKNGFYYIYFSWPKFKDKFHEEQVILDLTECLHCLQTSQLANSISQALRVAGENNGCPEVALKIMNLSDKLLIDFFIKFSEQVYNSSLPKNKVVMQPSDVFNTRGAKDD